MWRHDEPLPVATWEAFRDLADEYCVARTDPRTGRVIGTLGTPNNPCMAHTPVTPTITTVPIVSLVSSVSLVAVVFPI